MAALEEAGAPFALRREWSHAVPLRSRGACVVLLFCIGACPGAASGEATNSAPAGQTTTPPDAQVWAVICSPTLQRSGLGDLVTAAMGQVSGVRLVERDQIHAAIKELSIGQILTSGAVRDRLRLGRVLRADVLLILDIQQVPAAEIPAVSATPGRRPAAATPDGASKTAGQSREPAAPAAARQRIHVVISDCVQGARLCVEQIPFGGPDSEQVVNRIRDLAVRSRDRFAHGIRCVVGVSHFLSKTLIHDYDYMQASLAYVLGNALSSVPGVAVIEIEEAQAIRQERATAEGAQAERIVPLLVEGDYRVDAQPGKDPKLSLRIGFMDGARTTYALEAADLTLSGAAEYLRKEGLSWAQRVVGPTGAGRSFSADEQIKFMAAQADAFEKLGSYEQAIGLREACVLLNPDLPDQRLQLVREYRVALSPKPPGWGDRDLTDCPEIQRHFDRRLVGWRLCLEHLEYLIRHPDSVRPEVLLETCRELQFDAEHVWALIGYVRNDQQCSYHLDQISELKMAFLNRVFPLLWPGPNTDLWQMLAVDWAQTPFGCVCNDWWSRRIDQVRTVLTDIVPPAQPACESTVRFVEDFSILDRAIADATVRETETRRFVVELGASESPRNVMLSRLAALEYDLCIVRMTQAVPPAGMLKAAGDLTEEATESGMRHVAGAAQRLRSTLYDMRGRPRPEPPRKAAPVQVRRAASQPASAPAPIHAVAERVHFRLIDLSGNERKLTGKWQWTDQQTYGYYDPPLLRLVSLGDAAEVFWHECAVLLHNQPGVLREVCTSSEPNFDDVAWDGRRLWIATLRDGIRLLAGTGAAAGTIGRDQGLPPAEKGVKLFPIAPGRVLVAGAFGDPPRAWIAILQPEGVGPLVRVFHEAAETRPLRPASSDRSWETANLGFSPIRIGRYPSREPGSENVLVVGRSREHDFRREQTDQYTSLLVNLKTLTVSAPGVEIGSIPEQCYLLDDGCRLLNDYGVELRPPLGQSHFRDGFDRRQVVARPVRGSLCAFVDYGGYLYVPGQEAWHRLHPKARTNETILIDAPPGAGLHDADLIRRGFSVQPQLFERSFEINAGASVFYGLLVWSQQNEFFRLNVIEPAQRSALPASWATPVARAVVGKAAAGHRKWGREPAGVAPASREDTVRNWLCDAGCIVLLLAASLLIFLGVRGARTASPDKTASNTTTAITARRPTLLRRGVLFGGAAVCVAGAVWLSPFVDVMEGLRMEARLTGREDWAAKLPISRVVEYLEDPATVANAAQEIERRIRTRQSRTSDADVVGPALARVLGQYGRQLPAFQQVLHACSAMAAAGQLGQEPAAQFCRLLEQRTPRCSYDSIRRRIRIWGSTIDLADANSAGLIAHRTMSLLASGSGEPGKPIVDFYSSGEWSATSESLPQGSDASGALRLRLTTTWYHFGASFPRDQWAKQTPERRTVWLNDARGTAKLLVALTDDVILRQSDYQSALGTGDYWAMSRLGETDSGSEDWVARGAARNSSRPSPVGLSNTAAAASTASVPAPTTAEATPKPARTDGAIIVAVMPGSQAQALGIKAGDVITRLLDEPVGSARAFRELAARVEERRRELVARSAGREQVLQVEPGKIGILLADYGETYRGPLVEALTCFYREGPARAAEPFKRAIQAGLRFEDDSILQLMYAASLYYAADVTGAKAQLDDHCARLPEGQGWPEIIDYFCNIGPNADALVMHSARRAARTRVSIAPPSGLARYLSLRLHRYDDALVEAELAIQHASSGREYGEALSRQRYILDVLSLQPEAIQAVRRLQDDPGTIPFWGYAAFTAEQFGEVELAATLARSVFEEYRVNKGPFWAAETIRLNLAAGKLAAAQGFIDQVLTEPERMELGNWHVPTGYCWAQARELWLGLARSAAQHHNDRGDAIEAALRILCMQEKPDVSELEKLLRLQEQSAARVRDDQRKGLEGELRAQVALAGGEFAQAEELLVHAGRQAPPSMLEAARFLRRFGPSLTGDRRMWLRTTHAFPASGSGLFLLTRDGRLGRAAADATRITEIMPPLPAWWIHDPDRALLVSPTGRTVLATSQWSVYRLDDRESRWRAIARMPWSLSQGWDLSQFRPVLDEMVDALQVGRRQRDFVWPEAPSRGKDRLMPLMLSDGTWLVFDCSQPRFLCPREAAAKALAAEVEVYDVLPAPPEGNRVYLFSSGGLLDWQPFDAKVTVVALPGAVSGPITIAADQTGVREGCIRIGLLPSAGGTTFILETASGKLSREGLINEAYPATYWLQKPADWKRSECKRAFETAHLSWPFQKSGEPARKSAQSTTRSSAATEKN